MQITLKWKNLVEFLGAVSIVASLIFVGLQVRQSLQIGINETNLISLQSTISMRADINQNAATWAKGLSGDELNPVERVVFENLVTNVNDLAFFISISQDQLIGTSKINVVVSDFAIFLHNNPGARIVWEQREERLEKSREILLPITDEDDDSALGYVESVKAALKMLDDSSS
jgi:hypothetical protein